MFSRALAITAVVACELLTACDIQRRPTGPGGTRVDAVVVVPATVVLDPLQTYQFRAFGLNAAGDSVAASVVWSASAGTITEGALFTADSSDNDAVVTATLTGAPAISATASVRKRRIVTIVLTPASVTLQAGGVQQFTARGVMNTGDTVAVSANYSATGGAVTSGGLYTAASTAGSYRVIAARPNRSLADTAAVTITSIPVAAVAVSPTSASVPVGQTVQLTATPQDANGNPLTGRVVTWVSDATGVATVNGSGLVTGVAAGSSATLTATSEGKSGTAMVMVTAVSVPVASVAVNPASASVPVGQTVQLTATPEDANGSALIGRVVTWASSVPGVANVSASGLVTAVAAGTAMLTATSEGQSGTATVTTTAVPVALVTVTPASTSLFVGQTTQLSVTTTDSAGNVLTGRTITWASSSTTVATVSAAGLATAKAAGSATITATSEGKSATAAVTVTVAPVASVTVTPAPASVAAGQTVQLTATPKDANGNPLTGRVVTWATSNAAVATVSAGGLVSGLVVGTATITATSEAQSGSSAITVVAAGVGCAAACRYVAVNGNDANAGTKTAPWRTIQHAADVMNAGDTVIVNDGVYTGGANVVTITRSGTAAAWLVFRAANRWGAIIDGQNNSSTTGFEINGNYVRVEGFEVRYTSRYAMESYGGREDIAGNHDVVLVQNHLHDVGHICTGSTGGIVGVSAYSDNLTIERNVIHDIGRLGPGEQGCVEPNANWQNHDHGIYNGVGNNVVVRNNVFYNFTHGWAIQRYNGAGSVTTGLTIVNNTFGFPNPWRDAQIIIATTTNNIVIANNIFYQPLTAGVWFDGAGNGATLVGNVSTDAVQTLGTGLTMSGNLPNTDPLFVNATGFNFHLTAGSPARGLGVAAWCPAIDFDGVARAGACSAGAYQN